MKDRLKKLRNELSLTQQKFADRIGIKRGAIANYEVGRNIPTDAVLSLICREFGVNEKWLRTGEEPMFIEAETFNLDCYLKEKGASDEELDIIKVYFSLDIDVRRALVEHFKKHFLGQSGNEKREEHTNHDELAATTHQPTESDEERKQREWIEKVERERAEAHRMIDEEFDSRKKAQGELSATLAVRPAADDRRLTRAEKEAIMKRQLDAEEKAAISLVSTGTSGMAG